MKKIILAVCLCVLLAGCNNQQENQNNKDNSLDKQSNLEIYYPSEQINKNLE